MDFKKRTDNLRAKLAEKGIDSMFISQPENRYYLSGFDGSTGYLVITPQAAILATDFRYIEQAKAQAPNYEIFRITGETSEWFPKLLAEADVKRLGFEAGNMTVALYRQLTDILNKAQSGLKLVATEGLAESLRAVKEPGEIELISKAAALTDAAFEYIEGMMRAGMSEIKAAWEIEKFMRERGSQSPPFDLIVASGPNAALPHHKPSDRPIQTGEPVVVDIGTKINGYTSDLTRTFCIGEHDETFKKMYDIVLGAQLTALAIIAEGMSGSDADKLARTVIEEAGYGEAFGHGLGHGVGLATHELPRLGPNSSDRLASGMVFTVEPGIYIPGWGGIRIEDDALMENGKARVISKAKKVQE